MLPTLRQVATLAVLVGATLPLTAAASPRAAAPPPLLHPGPVDAWTGATFDRVGGAALVGGLAMVAFLLVAGVVALVVAARMLMATAPSSSTSRWSDHGREQSALELGGSRDETARVPTIPAPRRPLRSGARPHLTPTR